MSSRQGTATRDAMAAEIAALRSRAEQAEARVAQLARREEAAKTLAIAVDGLTWRLHAFRDIETIASALAAYRESSAPVVG